MEDALKRELKACYQFMLEHDLFAEWLSQKYKPKDRDKECQLSESRVGKAKRAQPFTRSLR
jgi:hypothetical protein